MWYVVVRIREAKVVVEPTTTSPVTAEGKVVSYYSVPHLFVFFDVQTVQHLFVFFYTKFSRIPTLRITFAET